MLVAGGIGAGAGAVTAKVVDVGVTDDFVAQLREMVRPGTTTVAVLADDVDAEAVLAELHRFEGARYVAGNLPLEAIQAVRDALGDPAATTALVPDRRLSPPNRRSPSAASGARVGSPRTPDRRRSRSTGADGARPRHRRPPVTDAAGSVRPPTRGYSSVT